MQVSRDRRAQFVACDLYAQPMRSDVVAYQLEMQVNRKQAGWAQSMGNNACPMNETTRFLPSPN